MSSNTMSRPICARIGIAISVSSAGERDRHEHFRHQENRRLGEQKQGHRARGYARIEISDVAALREWVGSGRSFRRCGERGGSDRMTDECETLVVDTYANRPVFRGKGPRGLPLATAVTRG